MTSGNGPATTSGPSRDVVLKTDKITIRFGGVRLITSMCRVKPLFASFSQKQPPGRSSMLKFRASPENVWAGFHHSATLFRKAR